MQQTSGYRAGDYPLLVGPAEAERLRRDRLRAMLRSQDAPDPTFAGWCWRRGVQRSAMLETAAQVAALGVVLWVFNYQLPKARREQDTFAVICSLLTALVALAWVLVVGIVLHSRG